MNTEERWVGMVLAATLWYFTGWWTLLTIPLCGRLWAMGGSAQYDKNWRRICVPIVLCGCMVLNSHSYIPLLSVAPFFVVLTLGYGIPDGMDAGSPIGRFWYIRCGQNDTKATIMTRATIGLLIGVSLLPLAFLSLEFFSIAVLMMMIFLPTIVACIT